MEISSLLLPADHRAEREERGARDVAVRMKSTLTTGRRRVSAYVPRKSNDPDTSQITSDGTPHRACQRLPTDSLARSNPLNEPEQVKSWYSRELATLSAINSSLSKSLAGSDHDTAQGVESVNEDVASTHSSILVRKEDRSSSISTVLDSSLDPFMASIVSITPRQQSLLQFFVRDYSPTMFGTSEMALYSPSQAVGLPSIRHSKIATQWICILADEILHAISGRERSRELSRQRAEGYLGLKLALRNRYDSFEEAMLGIVIAGLVEYSFGDARAQSLHTIAADMLVYSRGGVENAIRAAPNLEPFYIHAQYAFGRCRISSLTSLQNVLEEWLKELRSILTSDRLSWRKCERAHAGLTTCQCTPLEQNIVRIVSESLAMEDPSSFAVGMQLTLLIEVIATLAELSGSCSLATKYFKRIDLICYRSMITTRGGRQRCELRAGTLASICSRARRDILGQEFPQKLLISDTRHVEKHIIALKPFGYLSSTSQRLILDSLASWLQLRRKRDDFEENKLIMLSSEVTEMWRSCYDRHKSSPA